MRPFRPLLLAPVLLVSFFLLMGGGSTPATASFHEMRIYGVLGGADGSTEAQFVELREAIGSQTQVSNAQLCFYTPEGLMWARFVFPNNVTNGADDSSILIGSQAMEDAWNASGGAQLDFTFSASNTTALDAGADVNAPIPVPAGAIVYESQADTTCAGPEQNGAIDWLSYGTGFTGGTIFGTKFNHDLPPTDAGGIQLKTDPVVFPPTDNSTEYAVVDCIVARNNAGDEGTVGGGDCGPAELQGDADCDGDVDTNDGMVILANVASLGAIPCPERANVNCDASTDPRDSLGIFKFAADIGSAAAGCTPIGQPLPK